VICEQDRPLEEVFLDQMIEGYPAPRPEYPSSAATGFSRESAGPDGVLQARQRWNVLPAPGKCLFAGKRRCNDCQPEYSHGISKA
jgi:hypothetical protein